MKYFLHFLLCTLFSGAFGQTITHGPVVGGVTDTSCNIFVRTSAPTSFSVLLSNQHPFGAIVASGVGQTNATDNIAIVHIGGLTPNTQYYMKLTINGNPVEVPTTFSTFYAPDTVGRQVFLTGADIDNFTDGDSAIFNRAQAENARAFIELGNWGYPDASNGCIDIYLSNPPTSWANTYSNVQSLYKQRYSSTNMQNFIQSLAVDYVYDDHDYLNEKTGKDQALLYNADPFSGILAQPTSYSQPVAARENSLQGYQQYFPAYNLLDTTNGVYHSFKSGNAEFFVLDTRSARGQELVCVDTQGSTSHWAYTPLPGTHILGNQQMQWLQNGLRQSTATWKFIVSSVPFNMAMRFALDTLIELGNNDVPYWNPKISCNPLVLLGSHAYSSTNHFADLWSGFKADGDSLLNYVLGNNIPNVFVLSGSLGTAGLDDGANAGLPELMSGNMKIANTEDALNYQQLMGFNAWDLGGSGLCQQQDMNYTYGRVEIYNNDSVKLSAVDQNGVAVASGTFYAGAPYKYNPAYSPYRLPVAVADTVSFTRSDTANSVSVSVLSNDADLNGYPLFTNLKTNPAHGTATVNANNTISYIPDTGFTGVDTFYYSACDHSNPACTNCGNAKVTVIVNNVNGIPAMEGNVILAVYPNPANDYLLVQAYNSNEAMKLSLMNVLGQQLQQVSFTGSTRVATAGYAPGNYFYTITDTSGRLLKTGKVSVIR